MASGYSENPFASTHSLEDPFADNSAIPLPETNPSQSATAASLAQREAELAERERNLKAREEHVKKHGRNNWPPFYPLIYHSINDEIPEASRSLIMRLYQLWLLLLVTLVVNMVACIVILIAGSDDGARDVGASVTYVPIIGLLSFLLWYRPIYNAYMKEQSLYYYMYFFFGGWHLLFSAYMILGIPSTGSAGLIQSISMFHKSLVAAILGIVATTLWVVQGLGHAFYLRQIWNHHNAAGHSISKAKAELAEHGARSYFSRG